MGTTRISRRLFLAGVGVLLGLPRATAAWAHHKPGHRRRRVVVPVAQVLSVSVVHPVTAYRISDWSAPVVA